MKKLLLITVFFSMVGTSSLFADFGIGGLFAVQGNDVENNFNLSGGLTMAFIDKKNPLIWDTIVGGFTLADKAFNVNFNIQTRFEYHALVLDINDSIVFFLAPGVASHIGFLANIQQNPITGDTLTTASLNLGLGARLGLGLRFFAGDVFEFFIQGTPEIGWRYLATEIDGYGLLDAFFGKNEFYWLVEASVGLRFWV